MSDYKKEFEEEKKYGYSGSALDHYGEYILWLAEHLEKAEQALRKIYRHKDAELSITEIAEKALDDIGARK